ncbi:class F sortase [Cohnella zeiphila]|uniref:Class F sortase n=1 Tax=Cohnella zeiphila TaxID=2761120 RepID=A0A7X0VSZ0_9BACL|nr:class F sortase [Cohnella zeiphila]MBB6729324.1 class F sortase [Cohnella zeiphila]
MKISSFIFVWMCFVVVVIAGCSAGNGAAGPEAAGQPSPRTLSAVPPTPASPVQPESVQLRSAEPAPASPPPVLPPKPEPQPRARNADNARRAAFTPNRLLIPSVRIDAAVEPVGVLPNGQMDAPVSSQKAGILVPGVKPGQPGNAIIAGHEDNYRGPALFYPLKKLKAGDPVLVMNGKGRYLVFEVVSVETYKTDKAPIDRIFGAAGEPRLNLITCTGKFDRKLKEHEKRLIVFTRLLK